LVVLWTWICENGYLILKGMFMYRARDGVRKTNTGSGGGTMLLADFLCADTFGSRPGDFEFCFLAYMLM
jgi:hypothetical protein